MNKKLSHFGVVFRLFPENGTLKFQCFLGCSKKRLFVDLGTEKRVRPAQDQQQNRVFVERLEPRRLGISFLLFFLALGFQWENKKQQKIELWGPGGHPNFRSFFIGKKNSLRQGVPSP